jgi:ABC-type uncharacterized transport system substrate-binding protein
MKTGVTRRTASKIALAGLVTAQSSSTYAQGGTGPTARRVDADPNTIIAVAVGTPDNDHPITDPNNLGEVRPYIPGLVKGLEEKGFTLGSGYNILYRERPVNQLDDPDTFKADGAVKPIIFCMSTSVVGAAKTYTEASDKPVVAVVSDPKREQVYRRTNICGISARRSQTARECFEDFLATVPTLEQVYVLHKPNYNPSDDALKRIEKAAREAGVTITKSPVTDSGDIDTEAAKWTPRTKTQPATRGVLILPVDVLLGNALKIIRLAQAKFLPTFFPITDWVKPTSTSTNPSALGGYGASQYRCGQLMAERVAHIWTNWGTANQIPNPRWKFVSTIEWVTSPAAATYLGITLPDDVPTV